MGAASDILPVIVLYDFVPLRQSDIGPELVGVKNPLWAFVFPYDGAQGLALPVGDHLKGHPACFPAVRYDSNNHPLIPVAAQSLVAVPVLIDPAVKGFIHFNGHTVEGFLFRPAIPDAVEHGQGGFMGYLDVTGKLTGVDSCRGVSV